jgi:hypothetical protein
MPTETLLKIPFSVIGRCANLPLAEGKMRKNLLVTAGGFRYNDTELQVASCMHFINKKFRRLIYQSF